MPNLNYKPPSWSTGESVESMFFGPSPPEYTQPIKRGPLPPITPLGNTMPPVALGNRLPAWLGKLPSLASSAAQGLGQVGQSIGALAAPVANYAMNNMTFGYGSPPAAGPSPASPTPNTAQNQQSPPSQRTAGMPGYSMSSMPTLQNYGMNMGAGIMGNAIGAGTGYGATLQDAMGQMGGILQGNADRSAYNHAADLNYDLGMNGLALQGFGLTDQRRQNEAMMGLDWRQHTDDMGLKSRIIDILGGSMGGGYPQMSLPPGVAPPGQGNQGGQLWNPQGFDMMKRAQSRMPSNLGGENQQQYADAFQADMNRAMGNLDLAGTQADANYTRQAQLAYMQAMNQARGLSGQRYGDLLNDNLAGTRLLADQYRRI